MISLNQFQNILADALFNGNTEIAGLVMYSAVLVTIFALSKREFHIGIILSIPVTLVFRMLDVLSNEAALVLIVIEVLVLAFTAKKALGE